MPFFAKQKDQLVKIYFVSSSVTCVTNHEKCQKNLSLYLFDYFYFYWLTKTNKLRSLGWLMKFKKNRNIQPFFCSVNIFAFLLVGPLLLWAMLCIRSLQDRTLIRYIRWKGDCACSLSWHWHWSPSSSNAEATRACRIIQSLSQWILCVYISPNKHGYYSARRKIDKKDLCLTRNFDTSLHRDNIFFNKTNRRV